LSAQDAVGSGWEAELKLGFESRGDRTVLAERRHRGPLAVQRPFYPEGEVCHVYLLHPPGGVVGGDRLDIRATAGKESRALITTPAAGKFYRSEDMPARQTVHLTVDQSAALEWLPQESIFYRGASVVSEVNVDLAETARFIGWESFCLGRPASGETFDRGRAAFRWSVRVSGRPLLIERFEVDEEVLNANWGLQGQPIAASLFAYPALPKNLESVRAIAGDRAGFGATLIDGLLVCRALDSQIEPLRRLLVELWRAVRPDVIGRKACLPRIWAT
jgi:urease accessory protein